RTTFSTAISASEESKPQGNVGLVLFGAFLELELSEVVFYGNIARFSVKEVNVAIRTSLQSLREKIEQLRELLLRAVSTHQIATSTQLEGDRRQNLVDDLLTRHRQLEASYRNEGPEPDMSRSSLMAGGAKRGVTNPWLLEESEETRGLGFDELRQQQRRIIEEQDAGLDALSSIISRQKQMGQEIGNELDEQNEIIDDLTNLVESTDDRLRSQTRHVKMVDKKSTSCGRKWLQHKSFHTRAVLS
ncbi:hypothetical protein IHE44_0006707, partial [Lamprotornis superbus]